MPTGEPQACFHAARVAPDLLLHRAPIPGRELPGCRALSGMVQQPSGFRKVSRRMVGPEQKWPFQHGRQQAGAQPSSLHPLTSHIRGLGLHKGFCNDPQEKERRCECYRSYYSFTDDFFFFFFLLVISRPVSFLFWCGFTCFTWDTRTDRTASLMTTNEQEDKEIARETVLQI